MSYSTATSILPLLPGLPQTTASSGYTETTALIGSHITRADALINGKIASRYSPASIAVLSTTPALLTNLSEDITSYYTLRSQYSGDNLNTNEWTEKFQEAIDILDAIRKGDMDLVDEDGNVLDEGSEVYPIESNTQDYDPFFNEGDPLYWEVDSDKL